MKKNIFVKAFQIVFDVRFSTILTNSGKFFHQRHTGVGPFHWNSRDEKDLNRKYQKQFLIR